MKRKYLKMAIFLYFYLNRLTVLPNKTQIQNLPIDIQWLIINIYLFLQSNSDSKEADPFTSQLL